MILYFCTYNVTVDLLDILNTFFSAFHLDFCQLTYLSSFPLPHTKLLIHYKCLHYHTISDSFNYRLTAL